MTCKQMFCWSHAVLHFDGVKCSRILNFGHVMLLACNTMLFSVCLLNSCVTCISRVRVIIYYTISSLLMMILIVKVLFIVQSEKKRKNLGLWKPVLEISISLSVFTS